MRRGTRGIVGLVLAAALFVLFNAWARRALPASRIDLTENGLFTLSEGSRRLVENLDEPVSLTLYYSEELGADIAPVRTYHERVRGLLQEFASASQGRVRLRLVDPEPFSEAEDAAVEAGLRGAMVEPGRPDVLYLGLVGTSSTDDREVVPFLHWNKEASLEYDIARLIYRLGTPVKPVIGVLSALPVDGRPAMPFPGAPPATPPWYMLDQLRSVFDVRVLPAELREIPAEVSVLLVVHPKDVSETTLYAIDQYVLGGGNALIFTDPYCEVDRPPEDPSNPYAAMMAPRLSDLPSLFSAWGLQMLPDRVAADRTRAMPVNAGSAARPTLVDYAPWLALDATNYAADEVILDDLGPLRMLSAGVLKPIEGASTVFTPLLFTGPEGMELPLEKVSFMPDPQRILDDYAPGGTPMALAARVRGQVASAFPNGAPLVEGEEPDGPREHLVTSKEPIDVVVVADVDLLSDETWIETVNILGMRQALISAANGDFVLRATDHLTGSSDLIGIRGRKGSSRPFTRLDELRQEAESRFLAKEQALEERLRETEQRLTALQSQKQDQSSLILSPEQAAEIERFRAEQVATRKQLRAVQHELNKDLDALEARVKFVNIGLVPLLVTLGALLALAVRRRGKAA